MEILITLLLLLLTSSSSAQTTSTYQKEVTVTTLPTTDPTTLKPSSIPLPTLVSSRPSQSSRDEESWALLEAYLYSGNASFLSLANCSQSYRFPGLRRESRSTLDYFLRPALDALINAANFLNMIFQANDLRESSIKEDMEWYHALVRGLLEGDSFIRRALLTFEAQPTSERPQFVLQASRTSHRSQDILLQDLSSIWERNHLHDTSWYSELKYSSQQAPNLSKRVLLNDLNTLDSPKWGRGDSYVTNRRGVHWGDGPFLECDHGRFLPGWLLTLSTSFFGLKPDLSPEFRGVIRIDVNLQNFDLDQCAEVEDGFSSTHQCNHTSMQCEPIKGQGFRLGQYRCNCKEGYYRSPVIAQETGGWDDSIGNASGFFPPSLPECLPCWPGCRKCENGAPCKVQEDWHMRAFVVAIHGIFMISVLISMLAAYRYRQHKRIRASGLLLLEAILFGSVLLYFPVFILYFKPSTFRCILLRWVRLMGFAIVYGTITLKLYRVLRIFLSRTAQRVPYMSSVHVLRMLGAILLTVGWFLSAWTVSVLQNLERNIPLLITFTNSDGQRYSLCDLDRWDYMMAIAELLFLGWGGYMCNAVKMVPSAFHEPRYIGFAIHNELLLSSAFHLFRFFMPSVHPDWMLLLYFTHTHFTITVTLGLLFLPKFLRMTKPEQEEIATEVYEDEVVLRRCSSFLNNSMVSAWSEHNLDHDDVRDELKKLYTQLEVHKTKKMTANNPHISKKSSYRGIGHSIIKRIAEFPESFSRRCSRDEKEGSLNEEGRLHPGYSEKRASFSLHKSDTSSEYSRDHRSYYGDSKDPSLFGSSKRRRMAKRNFERANTKSVEEPFVYKSDSTQNLDDQLLQPMPYKLQKSLSIVVGNKDGSTLHPTRTGSVGNTPRSSRIYRQESQAKQDTRSQKAYDLLSDSFYKADVCPWELEKQLPDSKSESHVTFISDQQDSQKKHKRRESSATEQHVYSPYDTVQYEQPSNSSNWLEVETPNKERHSREYLNEDRREGSDSDSEFAKPQLPVSASAPHSPVACFARAKEHQVFSLRGAPCHFNLSWKSLRRSGKGSGKFKGKKGSVEKEKNGSSQENAAHCSMSVKLTSPTTPKAVGLRRENSKEPLSIVFTGDQITESQQRNMENSSAHDNGGTTLLNQQEANCLRDNAKTIQRTDSFRCLTGTQKNKANINESIYENICPWEAVRSDSIKEQRNAHTNVCPWETEDAQNRTPIKRNMSIQELESTTFQRCNDKDRFNAEVCPWDVQQQGPTKQNTMTEICPWEEEKASSPAKQSRARSSSEKLKKLVKKPKDGINVIYSWKADPLKRFTSLSGTEKIIMEEIQDKTQEGEKKEPNQSSDLYSKTRASDESALAQRVAKADVCPWDVTSQTALQPNNVAEVCPWDLPEIKPQENLHVICPWEGAESEMSSKRQECEGNNIKAEYIYRTKPTIIITTNQSENETNQTYVNAEVCPWDIPVGQKNVQEICPWEVDNTLMENDCKGEGSQETHSGTDCQNKGIYTNTSPMKSSDRKMQTLPIINVDVCPWDGPLPSQSMAEVCPWDIQDDCSFPMDTVKHSEAEMRGLESMPTTDTKENNADGGNDTLEETVETQDESSKELPERDVDINSWEKLNNKPCLVKQTAFQSSLEEREVRETNIANTMELCVRDSETQHETPNDKEFCHLETNKAGSSPDDVNPSVMDSVKEQTSAQDTKWETTSGEAEAEHASKDYGADNRHDSMKNKPLARCNALCPWEIQEVTPQPQRHDGMNPDAAPKEEEIDAEMEAESFYFPSDL